MKQELQTRTANALQNPDDRDRGSSWSTSITAGQLVERLERLYARHPAFDIPGERGPMARSGSASERIGERGLPLPRRAPTTGNDVFENFSVPDTAGSGCSAERSPRSDSPAGPSCHIPEENDRQLSELLAIMLLAGSLAVGCTLGGGYLLARQALAPVDRMAASADEITASQLDRRLHAPNPDDELGRLARTLNGMIARLERSFEEVRRFTADAAHELRTPLAILRNEAEVALRVPRDSEQYRECLEDMLEEIEHLSRLSEALLFLFREDAGCSGHAREPVHLDQIAREIADHLRVVAAEQGSETQRRGASPVPGHGQPGAAPPTSLQPAGQRDQVHPRRRQHSRPGRMREGPGRIIVTDSGVGIAPEHLPRIFDRFYRVDSARSRRTEGNGLGLSICRSIAESHDGSIEVKSTPAREPRSP